MTPEEIDEMKNRLILLQRIAESSRKALQYFETRFSAFDAQPWPLAVLKRDLEKLDRAKKG